MTPAPPDSDLDAARARVAQRDLTGPAVSALTGIVKRLPMEALAPVKQLLKRFFSDQPWTGADDDALAAIVGTGSGSERLALDPELTMAWGWEHGRFWLRVAGDEASGSGQSVGRSTDDSGVGQTFESDVVPEVTPSPRTIRFATPPLHTGPSRFYNSESEAAAEPRAARLFRDFDAVTNVLVGPDFVAVTILHSEQWQSLLVPVLRVVAEAFTGGDHTSDDAVAPTPAAPSSNAGSSPSDARMPGSLERAWADLGALRAEKPEDLARILTASRDTDPERRQVAAALLADAPVEVASEAWNRLFADQSRRVRRSVIDAVVDANREALRPLLERALADADAWTRWKSVHGLAALGVATSRAAIETCASDPDFRVRLEATRALA